LPFIEWTTVRLDVSENEWCRHNKDMEPPVTVSFIGSPTYDMGSASTVPKSSLISGQTVTRHQVIERPRNAAMGFVYNAEATRLHRLARRPLGP
jgi:hypothetical protein